MVSSRFFDENKHLFEPRCARSRCLPVGVHKLNLHKHDITTNAAAVAAVPWGSNTFFTQERQSRFS